MQGEPARATFEDRRCQLRPLPPVTATEQMPRLAAPRLSRALVVLLVGAAMLAAAGIAVRQAAAPAPAAGAAGGGTSRAQR
jgi:hypothetical protein